MNRNKKGILIVLGAILLAVLIGAVCIGLGMAPTVNHALHISQLLQPLIDAGNQAMRIDLSAKVGDRTVALDSDVYTVTEEDTRFLALEQKGITLYISENLLFLENGKAFKLGEKMQTQAASFPDLLPRIGAMYDVLKITAKETDDRTVYEITVTGDQVNTLLAAASLGEALPVDGIRELTLRLTEQNGELEQISFDGSGNMDGTPVSVNATLSGFRILAAGDYPIPEEVRQSAATVDPEELFSLSEDLYRLVRALAPFGDMEAINGTVVLTVDCGPVQLDTQLKLSDLKSSSDRRIDPAQLQALPEMLGWLCMEGDLRCTQLGDSYEYTLKLDRQAMGQLAGMILPELAQYSGNLTEGIVTLRLTTGTITSMKVAIEGNISVWITQVPISLGAEFTFDETASGA